MPLRVKFKPTFSGCDFLLVVCGRSPYWKCESEKAGSKNVPVLCCDVSVRRLILHMWYHLIFTTMLGISFITPILYTRYVHSIGAEALAQSLT